MDGHPGHEIYQHHGGHPVNDEEDMSMLDDHLDSSEYGMGFEDDEIPDGLTGNRAVHQCNICNKIFVSFKGLQQHSVIHTDQKPFQCDICGKSFRFKSNLFEHRSVHTGFTPHQCPYCGKTCRLKGNLKKHLKTHVATKEELEEAWRPFASNRRPPADIPEDAIIVRSAGEAFYTPPSRPRKRKLGLGSDPRLWIDRIRRGDILPTPTIDDKLRKLHEVYKEDLSVADILEFAKNISFERFDCPLCKSVFTSRADCADHINIEHPAARLDRPLFCEVCLKAFADRKSLEQHESYHKRVNLMIDHREIECPHIEPIYPYSDEIVDDEAAMMHHQPEMIVR